MVASAFEKQERRIHGEGWAVVLRRLVLLALVPFAATGLEAAAPAAEEPGFRSLFNGKDLTGWDGLPGVWSVEDGAITGRNRAEAPLEGNTFLIWKDGTVGDFTLRLKFRFQPVAGADMAQGQLGRPVPQPGDRPREEGGGRVPGGHGRRGEVRGHAL